MEALSTWKGLSTSRFTVGRSDPCAQEPLVSVSVNLPPGRHGPQKERRVCLQSAVRLPGFYKGEWAAGLSTPHMPSHHLFLVEHAWSSLCHLIPVAHEECTPDPWVLATPSVPAGVGSGMHSSVQVRKGMQDSTHFPNSSPAFFYPWLLMLLVLLKIQQFKQGWVSVLLCRPDIQLSHS